MNAQIISDIKTEINSHFDSEYTTFLQKRSNHAIRAVLRGYKDKRSKLVIPEWGGWMTYEPFGVKMKYEVVKCPTVDEVLDMEWLRSNLDSDSILLLHALAGYHTHLDVCAIRDICDERGCVFVEDVSGCLDFVHHGHIILGSFGRAKPVNTGFGGFCSVSKGFEIELEDYDELTDEQLSEILVKLRAIDERVEFLYEKRDECVAAFEEQVPALAENVIAHSESLVVIVPYSSDEEKQLVIDFCAANEYEYTECPRYIRTSKVAISIEIKRL